MFRKIFFSFLILLFTSSVFAGNPGMKVRDPMLEIATGNVTKYSSVNKFGRAPTGVQTTATDIWDRADATPTQQIWVAPTQARLHNIVSSSASDTSVGTGTKTIKIYGLQTWDTSEINETITMNGTSDVSTANSYVIIHRMKAETYGAATGGPNVGTISATAVSDATVTAAILPGEGQTQMAIYGISSLEKAYLKSYYASTNLAGTSIRLDVSLKVNPIPGTSLINFLTKQTQNIRDTGTGYFRHVFDPPMEIDGPAIIKMQCVSSVADSDGSAGFDLILIDD